MKPGIGALVGLVVALTAAPGLAQDSKDVGVSLKAGMNISKITQSDGNGTGIFRGGRVGSSDTRTGWAVGAAVRVPISSRFSLQPEVYYAKRGGKDPNVEHDWSYIEAPVLLNIALAKAGSGNVFAVVGPEIGARARAKVIVGTAAPTAVTRFVVGGDTGIAVGGGVEFMRFSVEGRFVQGLTDSITSVGHLANGFGPGKVKNQQIMVLAGYRFATIKR